MDWPLLYESKYKQLTRNFIGPLQTHQGVDLTFWPVLCSSYAFTSGLISYKNLLMTHFSLLKTEYRSKRTHIIVNALEIATCGFPVSLQSCMYWQRIWMFSSVYFSSRNSTFWGTTMDFSGLGTLTSGDERNFFRLARLGNVSTISWWCTARPFKQCLTII